MFTVAPQCQSMDKLGLKNLSRKLVAICAISYFFSLYLILHTCVKHPMWQRLNFSWGNQTPQVCNFNTMSVVRQLLKNQSHTVHHHKMIPFALSIQMHIIISRHICLHKIQSHVWILLILPMPCFPMKYLFTYTKLLIQSSTGKTNPSILLMSCVNSTNTTNSMFSYEVFGNY
jgi:hypothetical protein